MYCYQCGEKLFSSEEDTSSLDEALPKKAGFKILPIILFLALFTALGGGAYFLLRKNVPASGKPSIAGEASKSAEVVSDERKLTVKDVYFPMSEETLDINLFSGITPSDIDLYFESTHPEKLLIDRLGTDFPNQFKEKVGLSLDEAVSFLKLSYALLLKTREGKEEWGLITKIESADFVTEKLSTLKEEDFPGIQIVAFNDYLIISDSEALITEIKSVSAGEILSLKSNPGFSESRQRLSKSGQAYLWVKKGNVALLDKFLPESLSSFSKGLSATSEEGFLILRVKTGTEITY